MLSKERYYRLSHSVVTSDVDRDVPNTASLLKTMRAGSVVRGCDWMEFHDYDWRIFERFPQLSAATRLLCCCVC